MSQAVTELLQTLVRIPSINPGQAKNADWAGEAGMIDFLSRHLSSLGAEITLDGPSEERPNLIARFAPLDGRPRVLLGPHMDTVDVTGMSIPPFDASISDGKIWGRGSSDTKGPMAAMLSALAARRHQLAEIPVAVDFVAFSDEELYQSGSIHFASHHARDYQFAFVGEPTSLQFVHASKGACHLKLSAKGRAAHASQPERGDNAILRLASALTAIERDFVPSFTRQYHDPDLGPSTLNVGMIKGGTQANVVAAQAQAILDSRFTPACLEAGGPAHLLRDFLSKHHPDIDLELIKQNPPMKTPTEHPLLQSVRERLPEAKCCGAPWFSDAAHLAAAGLPAVCIGPGSIDQAHTADEFIRIEDLKAGEDFFIRLIDALHDLTV